MVSNTATFNEDTEIATSGGLIATSGVVVSAVYLDSTVNLPEALENRGLTVRDQDVGIADKIKELGLLLPDLQKQLVEGKAPEPTRLNEPQKSADAVIGKD